MMLKRTPGVENSNTNKMKKIPQVMTQMGSGQPSVRRKIHSGTGAMPTLQTKSSAMAIRWTMRAGSCEYIHIMLYSWLLMLVSKVLK